MSFPLPEETPLSQPYWHALRQGRLTFQRCRKCRHAWLPPRAECPECLAAEWGRSGVRVNAVSPGYTLTPALQSAIDKGQRDVSLLNENSALGRMVSTEEVARAVCFLASEDASAITGANLPVDCGWLVTPSWHTYGGLRPARR